MSDAWLMALGSLLTAVITAAVAGLIAFLNAMAKNRRDREDSTAARQNAIIDRLEKQLERQEKLAEEGQKDIARLNEMHAECREESAEARAVGEYAIDLGRRLHTQLLAAGIKVDPLPDFRLPGRRTSPEEAEFLQRTTAQNATLVGALSPHAGSSAPAPAPQPTAPGGAP